MSENDKPELLKFPCEFPLKVVGKACDEFEMEVLVIVRKHVPDLAENAVQARSSKDGNYLSLTITINAQSQAQLDNLYSELSSCTQVIMAL